MLVLIIILGAFFLYAGISFTGFMIFYFFAPETRGRRIEEIERLFMNEKKARDQPQGKNAYGSTS